MHCGSNATPPVHPKTIIKDRLLVVISETFGGDGGDDLDFAAVHALFVDGAAHPAKVI